MDHSEPDLADYLSEIRRGARLVGLLLVVGALLGLAAGLRRGDDPGRVASATISVTDVGGPIDLWLGADKERPLDIAPMLAWLSSPVVEPTVRQAADLPESTKLSVSATGDEANHLIQLRVRATDDKTARDALAAVLTELTEMQRTAVAQRYEGLRAGLEANRARLELLLRDIDAQVATVPSGSPAADYSIAKGLQARADLDEATEQIETIDHTASLTSGGLQQVGDVIVGPASASGASLLDVVIGAGLGGLVALGFLFVRRFLSSPTDSRSAVERCGVTCLAVAPSRDSEHGDPEVAGALRHILEGGPVVAVTGEHVTKTAIERIAALAGGEIHFPDDVFTAGTGSRVLLVVDRRTPEDELRAMAFSIRSVGATPIGAILTGIPRRDLNRARSR